MKNKPGERQPRRIPVLFMIGITMVAVAVGLLCRADLSDTGVKGMNTAAAPSVTLESILASSNIAEVDLLTLNLACAVNLPGSSNLSIHDAQATLDSWATRVKAETEKYLPRFHANPASFNTSEPYFRVLTMVTVLQQDCGVRYNQAHRGAFESNDSFFADASDVLLHGILGPKRQGTCSSIPVLYVAVGRKLGYPLKLVTTRGHLFCRWEGSKERFNIEATNEGLNCFPDDYYQRWPFQLTDEEVKSGRYLRSLSPKEELALFLQNRGMCMKAAGRFAEARTAWAKARELAPDWTEHEMLIASVGGK